MLLDDLNKLEKLIADTKNLSPERRKELQHLAQQLSVELQQLAKTKSEKAERILAHAKTVVHEALTEDKDADIYAATISNLQRSIREFEVTHPALTRVIQQICIAFGV